MILNDKDEQVVFTVDVTNRVCYRLNFNDSDSNSASILSDS